MISLSHRHSRVLPVLLAAALSLLTLALGGCAGQTPPKSSPNTSAVIDNNRPIYSDSIPSSADVILLTTLYNAYPYETVTINNMEYHWQFELFQVVRIEKGQWNYATLSFNCVDSYTQNSNGSGKRPWPYHSGVYFRFWLNTRQIPARIVGQQIVYPQG